MFKFNAEVRSTLGTGASRRLRRNNQVPAIIYGNASEAPISIVLDHDLVNNAQAKPEFYTETMIIVVDGKEISVKPQAMQRHLYKPKLVHIDFKRV